MTEWRSINDAWPEYGHRVLAAYRSRKGEWIAEVVTGENVLVTSSRKQFPGTHWTPLPDPPQQGGPA